MTTSHVVIVAYDGSFQPESVNKNPEKGVVFAVMDPPMTLAEALKHVRDFNQAELEKNHGYWATARQAAVLPQINETILLSNQN